MPSQGLTLSSDYEFKLYDPISGGTLDLGLVTDIDPKATVKSFSAEPYNDEAIVHEHSRGGFKFTFKAKRRNSKLEDAYDMRMDLRAKGFDVPPCQLFQTIKDGAGVFKRYRYGNVDWHISDYGKLKRDTHVDMTIEVNAGAREKIQ